MDGEDVEPPARAPADVRIETTAALQQLRAVIQAEGAQSTAVVGVHAKATRPVTKWMRKLEMEVGLASRMKQMLLAPLFNDAQDWLADDLLRPFDFRPPQGDEIVCLATADFPAVREWLDALEAPGHWATFSRAEWIQRNLSGVFIILQFPSGAPPLIAFTRWSDALLLKRRGITATLNVNRFSLADTRQDIYLPDRVDFFVYNGIVFCLNWENFEKAISFRETTRTAASTNWTTFQNDVALHEPDAIWSVIDKSVRHQNTINRSFSNPSRVSPSVERIATFIADRNLNIKIEDGRLIIDPNDKEQILHLITIIADGYVTSDLTDRRLRTMDAEEYSAPNNI